MEPKGLLLYSQEPFGGRVQRFVTNCFLTVRS